MQNALATAEDEATTHIVNHCVESQTCQAHTTAATVAAMATIACMGFIADALNQLMSLPGMLGYVVINFDGKL